MNAKIAAGFVLAGLLIAGIAAYLSRSPAPDAGPAAVPAVVQPVAVPQAEDTVDFALADLDGNTRSISEWNGKARLINFWATWCAPCRREIPLLKETQAEHGAGILQVIGVAVEDVEPVQGYAAEAQFNYPILVGQDEAMAAAEASGIPFIGLPFTIVLGPGGELLGTRMGEIHAAEIDLIVAVATRLQAGEIDVASAKSALSDL